MLTRNAAAGRPRGLAAFPLTMHPVLFVVPWPELGVPLWPAFALLSACGALIAAVAVRRGNRFFLVLGGLLAAAALGLVFTSRESRLFVAPFDVRVWGVCFAAALAAGSAIAIRRGAARGIEREHVARACIAAAVGAVVGARIAWVLLHPTASGSIDGTVAFYRGGLSAWGGIAGALAGAKLSARANGTSFRELVDLAAPSFGVGVVLVRIGCFFEGCDFGVPLASGAPRVLAALGTFPKDSPAWVEHVLSRGLSPSATASLAVHPVELYEALGGVLLVAGAFLLERRKIRPGVAFAAVSVVYLLLRVSLDGLRDDPSEMWVSRALLLFVGLIGGATFGIRSLRARGPTARPIEK